MAAENGQSGEVRQRKKAKQATKKSPANGRPAASKERSHPENLLESSPEDWRILAMAVWRLFGFILMLYSGYWFSGYVQMLHENNLWFSSIQQVEREISLRTECGLL